MTEAVATKKGNKMWMYAAAGIAVIGVIAVIMLVARKGGAATVKA